MSTETPAMKHSPKVSERLSTCLVWAAIVVATATVCTLPWLLGGVIPKARLVLQLGVVSAAILSLLGRLIAGRSFAMPPLGTCLLLGMAGIGIIQLQPWMPSAISQMNHSVHPEFRVYLTGDNAGATGTGLRTPADSRSVAPAQTRQHVAQWVAVALLLCVFADSISSGRQAKCVLAMMCANASVFTILSLLQSFSESRWFGEGWLITNKMPFGTFVNQNNAAGWLLVHVAFAIGLSVIVFTTSRSSSGSSQSKGLLSTREWGRGVFSRIRYRIASLNSVQVLSVVAIALLLAGVAATRSRGGIVAAVCCLLTCAASRMQFRHSLLWLLPCCLLFTVVGAFLVALELDGPILADLLTLKNPVLEANSRVLHWKDSLASFQDFPVWGSGQGAYAWSTRPYLRHGETAWFRNADNQYVEILVESGLLGVSLCVGFGAWLSVLSLKLMSKRQEDQVYDLSQRHRVGIGLAGLAIVASQAVAACSDFGIGLNSTIAAIAMFAGISTAVVCRQSVNLDGGHTSSSAQGLVSGSLIRIAMIVAAAVAVPELRHLDQIDPVVSETALLFDSPVTRDRLKRLPILDKRLTTALKHYPDHNTVRRSQMKIVEARFRLRVLDQLATAGEPLGDKQLQKAWTQLKPMGLLERLASARMALPAEDFDQLQSIINSVLEQFPWPKMAMKLSGQAPLTPNVAIIAAAGHSATGKATDEHLRQLNAVKFTDPAGARPLFQCGLLALLADQPQQAREFWIQSLKSSERFRVPILVNALRFWSHTETVDMFAPVDFATTVRTALAKTTPELTIGLLEKAEFQWLKVSQMPSRDQRIQRAVFLIHTQSTDKASEWINHCLAELPDLSALRPMRAKLLEEQGNWDEAIGEWIRFQHFEPADRRSTRAIERLKKLTAKAADGS